MSTPPENAPTERQPVVADPPPPASTRSGRSSGGGYDPVSRIALIVIAAVMVIFLVLVLGGYHFNVTTDKGKDRGDRGGKDHTPKVTHSANP